jgi:GC-rich sequence DNA-binding factor
VADSRCSEAEDEGDEETKEWELAQVRRAGNWEEDAPLKPAKRGYVPAPSKTLSPSVDLISDATVPVARPMPTIPPAQARIAKALAEASATKSEGERALEIAAKDLSLLEEQERDIRKEVERVEAKREWVEEFRIWVEMLGEFLEEKVGQRCNSVPADAA